MIDSCFSGQGSRSVSVLNARPLMTVSDGGPATPGRLTVITAAAGREEATSLPAENHGTFSFYLLKGIAGAADANSDGHVSVDELFQFVRGNVVRAAQLQSRQQTPQLYTADRGLLLY